MKQFPPMVSRWAEMALEAAKRFGLQVDLILAVIAVESSGNPSAQAKTTSAAGLMQMTQAAFADVGADWSRRYDPHTNIMAGSEYLSRLVKRFGERHAIEAYYQGAGNENKELAGQHVALEAATKDYANRVFEYVAV